MGNCCTDSFNFKDFNDDKVNFNNIIKEYNEKQEIDVNDIKKEVKDIKEEVKDIKEEVKYGLTRKNCIYRL